MEISLEQYNKMAERITELEYLLAERQWVPVSVRLPKYGEVVLITNSKGNVRSGRFRGVERWKDDGDSWWTFKGNTVEHVVAWMPLPEPYKGGGK